MKNIAKILASIIVCEAAGAIGSIFTAPAISTWYATLHKPWFTPPNWVFAPVWIILFLLMGISFYLVWAKNWKITVSENETNFKKFWNPISKKLWFGTWKEENVVLIFVLQLILNVLWSFIFFGFKSPAFAFAEILMLWVAIIYTIVNFSRVSKTAALLLTPYILWVTLAAILNLSILFLNY